MFLLRRAEGQIACGGDRFSDIVGRGAAAAAEAAHAGLCNVAHAGGKAVGVHVEHGFAVFDLRQPGVGIDHDGQGGALHVLRGDIFHLLRPKRAVGAEGGNAEALQHGHRGGHVGAREQMAAFVIGVGDDNRQITVLFGGQHGGLGFIEVAHGLDQNQIEPAGGGNAHAFGEHVDRVLKSEIAQRTQQLAERAHVERKINRIFVSCIAGFGAGHVVVGGADDRVEVIELEPVCAEGVRCDHVGAGFHIGKVDLFQHGRMRQVPRFGQFARAKTLFLQQRTHPAVKIGTAGTQTLCDRHGRTPFFY